MIASFGVAFDQSGRDLTALRATGALDGVDTTIKPLVDRIDTAAAGSCK